jgi:hypothetical protein
MSIVGTTPKMQPVGVHLFEGESVTIKRDERLSITQSMTDDEINNKYIAGDVRIVSEQARYPLDQVVTMIDSKKYILTPDFQRRRRWGGERKSKLIESFIMNVPVPPIFLYESSFAAYEVMDGQQRMSTIYDFYKDKFSLTGLQEWKELNGKTYSNLPDQVRAGIDRRYISSIILLKETGKNPEQERELKKIVFERLNSGGVKLEPQETRNALYDGKLNDLCIQLSENSTFRKLWKIDVIDDENEILVDSDDNENRVSSEMFSRMDDVELVLRFFMYRHINNIDSISLTEILDSFLIQGNKFSDSVLQKYKQLFLETVDLIFLVLGENAFELYRKGRKGSKNEENWEWSGKPMKVVYDPIMQAFSQFVDNKQELIEKKEVIQNEIKNFYKKESDLFDGRKTTTNNVAERIQTTLLFLQDHFD